MANLNTLPEIPSSSNRLTRMTLLKKVLLVCGVLISIGAVAGILSAVLLTQLPKQTTTNSSSTTNQPSSTTIIVSTSTGSSNTTVMNTNTTISSSSSSTTLCPTNVCSATTSYMLTSSGYYGYEHVDLNCTQTLSNLSAFIYVRRTVSASPVTQYNTFYSGTVNQGYSNTSLLITFYWMSNFNQSISSSGFPYYIEGQFQLQGINQTVMNDTYMITTQSACNGQMLTLSGHF